MKVDDSNDIMSRHFHIQIKEPEDEVSPEIHWEFALKHDLRWLKRWGLIYYGCREPLDGKLDLMKRIPNLRKISVSP